VSTAADNTENAHPHHPQPVTILVNRRDVQLPDDHATGLQIKEAADVPTMFKLFDPHGDEIHNDQEVRVHEHERFTAISGQDVS
jgi:hypothetical protein